jgi:ADP-ribose pyrophosphatase YjhB (NUDIX family)
VLLFDESRNLLLVRFVIAQADEPAFVFWAAPGGEVEEGETPILAAGREIVEELGLELEMKGPVRVDQNSFSLRGEMVDNTDYYFVAECPAEAPTLRGVTADEIAIMKEIRWWTVAELQATTERVFPDGLADWVRELSVV